MPKIRDIIVHVCVETAQRPRKCFRNREHAISSGERCLVVKTGPTSSKQNYCRNCACRILRFATDKLARLKDDIDKWT